MVITTRAPCEKMILTLLFVDLVRSDTHIERRSNQKAPRVAHNQELANYFTLFAAESTFLFRLPIVDLIFILHGASCIAA